MEHAKGFRLVFAPEVVGHLEMIERRYHALIRQTVSERLTHEPNRPARNRKQLEQPALYEATWELRFGPGNRFRVFYDVDLAERVVHVLAIGVKRRERLSIGREEFGP